MLEKFLSQQMDAEITSLQKLSSGMFSQAYSFVVDKKEYVLRLNKHKKDFAKDIYAFENFGDQLPIPKILKHGKYDDEFYFAITSKCKGVMHNKINNPKKIVPEIIKAIEIMRSIDIAKKPGFGLLDENGCGTNDNWREAIVSLYNHKFPQINIEKLFNDSILEREFFEKTFKKSSNLLAFIPEEKYLVHGDFGFDNLIIDDNKITGILDWAESKYGDFLYDVAWLDFWSNDVEYAREFKNYYNANKIDVLHFDERIECYCLHIGLGSLILAAFLNDKQDYAKIKERLEK